MSAPGHLTVLVGGPMHGGGDELDDDAGKADELGEKCTKRFLEALKGGDEKAAWEEFKKMQSLADDDEDEHEEEGEGDEHEELGGSY